MTGDFDGMALNTSDSDAELDKRACAEEGVNDAVG